MNSIGKNGLDFSEGTVRQSGKGEKDERFPFSNGRVIQVIEL